MPHKKSFSFVVPLALVLLALGIWFGFRSGWVSFPKKPAVQPVAEAAPAPTPSPTPMPEVQVWEELKSVVGAGNVEASKKALVDFIQTHPTHAEIWTAKKTLGDIQHQLLFGNGNFPGKTSYPVVQGDTLSKIASKQNTTIEFLMLANQMENALIRIGQPLQVIPADFAVNIDLPNRCIILSREGNFYRFYPIIRTYNMAAGDTPVTGAVSRKMAWSGGSQISPGTKKHLDATRWIATTAQGVTIYGQEVSATPIAAATPDANSSPAASPSASPAAASPTPSPAPTNPPPGPFVEVSQADALEISALAGTGSVVNLIPAPATP